MNNKHSLLCIPAFKLFALALLLCSGSAMAASSEGAAVYKQHCQACHQAGGAGVPGVFPPLKDNSNLADNPSYIAEAVIKGVSGPIEVNGKKYNGAMPAMRQVNTKQIGALVTYLAELNGIEAILTEDEIESLR